MFCKNCGKQLPDTAAFCPGCGTKLSGSKTYGDERSNADARNIPSYAKECDRSGYTVDSDRKKYSLSDKSRGDSGDGIVRISANRDPDASPKEPTGFVNPLKDSGGTVFRSDDASSGPEQTATAAGSAPREPDAILEGDGETTGFVNPLKDSGRDIQWGKDGDRNQQAPDVGEIDSHMGFAIIVTVLGCCNCLNLVLGITAIVFASQVPKYIEEGNFEQARKSSNTAYLLCWIALGLMVLGFVFSAVTGALSEVFNSFAP